MDNITAKATEHGDYAYQYDDLYRLTDTDNPDQADEAFDYDGVGNRLAAADTTGEWAYNANNELAGFDDTAFAYDANGNMIEKNVGGVITRFFYNLEDRLERVENGSGSVIASYYYDPFGRRLWKDVGGARTCFLYSDAGLVGEYDGAGAEIKTYGWKPGAAWSTDPVFMKQNGNYYFYHNDHLGTPQKLSTTSGAVVWSAKYSSFLEATIDASSTITNNLRAAGQHDDAETGLYYNWFRYYQPDVGRYLRTDPIGLNGGINYYIYALSNPIFYSDPFGLHGSYTNPHPHNPDGDSLNITDLFCPLTSFFSANSLAQSWRWTFKREYQKDMYQCLNNYLNDLNLCRQGKDSCKASRLSCKDQAKFDWIKCKLKANQWKILIENYGYWDSYWEQIANLMRMRKRTCKDVREDINNYRIR